ncbi:MAG: glycosyltransferase [Candidatus Peribacteria bacterium]|nr:glycosyltransferase [Candidatus Peribacteria bacterium]
MNQEKVATYFNSSDMFLYPTLMDSFGLVVAESLSCGCPIVTFKT